MLRSAAFSLAKRSRIAQLKRNASSKPFHLPEEPPSNYPYGLVSSITLFSLFMMTLPPTDFYPLTKTAGFIL
jgi:hypothetical protein